MPDLLFHAPSDIARYALIERAVGTLPDDNTDWPIFAGVEPERPDSLIVVHDTAPILHGRTMPDMEQQLHYGVSVKIRAPTQVAANAKAFAIFYNLQTAYQVVVTIAAEAYLVHSFNLASGPIYIGMEPVGSRHLTTINYLFAVTKL